MILIVDDRPENLFSLSSILTSYSFEVDTAASGEEALKKTLKHTYSLIILDVQMPGMDGFEVAEFLAGNKATRDVPVIFLSAVNTEKKFIKKGYSSGAIDYVVKPIDPDILILKVQTFIRLYEQNKALEKAQQELRSEINFRKKAQLQFQQKAFELNSVLISIPQVAFTATADGKIDFVNDRWYEYSLSLSVFPKTDPQFEAIDTAWKRMLTGKDGLEMETRIAKCNTGEFVYHLLRVVPVTEGNEVKKWVGTFTDIDEQKQAVKRMDEFVGMASHELKTPLTSAKGYLQFLEQMIIPDEKVRPFVERSLKQVNRLEGLINDLLDISKIENGELKFELKDIEFTEILLPALEMLKQINPESDIQLTVLNSGLIRANDIRLEQVIINFVSNAVKYSPTNKQVEITVDRTANNELYFAVKDHGIGISPESRDKVFSKFYRDPGANKYAQGLGVGLYICSEILRKHQADFGVISEPGQGSLFYFKIPLAL